MKRNQTLILVLLLVVLLILVYLPDIMPKKKAYPDFVATVDTAQVTRIVVEATDDSLELVRSPAGWTMTRPVNLPVEKYQIDRMLRTLGSMRVAALVSENSERFADFQVEEHQALHVRAWEGDRQTADFLLGKASEDGRQSYVRLPESSQVLQLPQNVTSSFKTKSSNIFKKELLSFQKEDLTRIHVEDLEEQKNGFTLELADSVWTLADARNRNRDADSTKVQQFLQRILRVRASSLILPAEETTEQLAVPLAHVAIDTHGDRRQLDFYRDVNDEKKYILVSDLYPYRFQVYKTTLDNFRKGWEYFQPDAK